MHLVHFASTLHDMKWPGIVLLVGIVVIGLSGAEFESLAPRFTSVERLSPERLRATHEAREQFAKQRTEVLDVWSYEDYRAVIHVHAEDSDHTRGTRAEVLAAAKKTGVKVVLFTDHRGPKPQTWRGLRDGVLFLAGAEESDGRLRFPEFDDAGKPRTENELKFVCHVEERLEADTKGFAGMEIVNRHSDQKLDQHLEGFLGRVVTDEAGWIQLTNSLAQWPDEVFGSGCDYRVEIMAKWDRELQSRRLTGIGANDAHQNVVLRGVTFDPYEVSFRNLSTHLLLRELNEAEVRRALQVGHCYVSHDWLADPSGFIFGAVNNLGVFAMGDTATMQGTTRVTGVTPVPCRQRLIFEGRVLAETNGTNLTFKARKPGAYRLEAWLQVAGEWRPWIYSNPVYLQEPSLFNLPLPNTLESTIVEVRKGIEYVAGKPEESAKHRLDLFVPKSNGLAPVFLFVHGGAWRTGDRALYGPVGQRFARDGILTVIPSYRLAPKNPWPAQAEDAAAALAWTVRHIAEHGGDTNRIFIGGHSAGGHLTSLLVFNDRYLQPHGLTASLLRGVISLSGIYNLDIGDSMASVFGRQREVRRDASPLFGVRAPAPPFFVSYCQWDYPTLPAQAKRFYLALRKADIEAQLFFTPGDNHIFEMISLTQDEDETAQAVVKFIREHGGSGTGQ
jgi:acetyl esterase/lipase